ncbi:MAG: glycosyltransferase family 4 protein, partial [Pirellula sp.]
MRVNLRVLITNLILDQGTGSEMYVADLAVELQALGHTPIVYSPRTGPLARTLELRGICVIHDLERFDGPPDVIHGHHTLETIAAALRFPYTPCLFVCHDCSAWHDTPPDLPNIIRYVAVDRACYDRLVIQAGVPESRCSILTNGVDLGRFRLRSSLPEKPTSILCFGYEYDLAFLEWLNQCTGLQVAAIGRGTSNGYVNDPSEVLHRFDIVLAKGRSAREAIATGAVTIVAERDRLGGLVTMENYERQEINNFGRRLLNRPYSNDILLDVLSQYNTSDAMTVAQHHREQTNLFRRVHQLLEIYEQMIGVWDANSYRADEFRIKCVKWVEWASVHANRELPARPIEFPRPKMQTPVVSAQEIATSP